METYFFQPNEQATLSLYNGTFERSENIIARDRMLDASLVGQGTRTQIESSQWKDKDTTVTQLSFDTGKAGTYVFGVSTKARNIELEAAKFNDYLEHDGVLDMLEKRQTEGLLEQDAVENYQKHVKAIYQVGEKRTEDWNTVLGYPIEFVPMENPYEKYSGEQLEIKLLLDGKPLTNQVVYADYKKSAHTHHHHDHSHEHGDHDHNHGHSHSHDHSHDGHDHTHGSEEHTHTNGQQLRTNNEGVITVNLPEDGIYYLRTIHMVEVTNHEELTHESKWATLTFEVTHKHDEHSHNHEHKAGIPTWVFILGSLLIIGVLFVVFSRTKS